MWPEVWCWDAALPDPRQLQDRERSSSESREDPRQRQAERGCAGAVLGLSGKLWLSRFLDPFLSSLHFWVAQGQRCPVLVGRQVRWFPIAAAGSCQHGTGVRRHPRRGVEEFGERLLEHGWEEGSGEAYSPDTAFPRAAPRVCVRLCHFRDGRTEGLPSSQRHKLGSEPRPLPDRLPLALRELPSLGAGSEAGTYTGTVSSAGLSPRCRQRAWLGQAPRAACPRRIQPCCERAGGDGQAAALPSVSLSPAGRLGLAIYPPSASSSSPRPRCPWAWAKRAQAQQGRPSCKASCTSFSPSPATLAPYKVTVCNCLNDIQPIRTPSRGEQAGESRQETFPKVLACVPGCKFCCPHQRKH
nr:PREDICTED: uncharacterized protein LOC104150590 [Struthio camelus australis]